MNNLLKMLVRFSSSASTSNTNDDLPMGCMWCNHFTGKGCGLTGHQFAEWHNIAVRAKPCPLDEKKN